MNRSRAFLIPILALCLALSSVAPAWAATGADLRKHQAAADKAREQAAAAEKTARQLAGEVEALEGRIEALQREASALDPKIGVAAKRTAQLQYEVDKLRSECNKTQAQINETQADFDTQRALLADRVEASYKQGSWFYLDMLLGSQDFNDLISRTELVSRVIESNNNIAAGLSATKTSLEYAKSKLDRSLDTVALKRREAAAVEKELRSLRAERQGKADAQAAMQAQKADLMQDNRKNAARLRALAESEERESDRIASQLAGGGSGVFTGTMTWPVPSSHRITSEYGYRNCPFHGRELHPGIDIGAPQGSAIVAAASGKVIYAGYRGGYGNTLMVDHGNGVVTLYAHQMAGGLKVSNGQSVSAGQRIGTVGSTGNSTGPHLHFEVRVNGAPKNPHGYLGG